MKHTLLIKDWLSSFLSLLFPRCCVVCGRPLAKGEECICTVCNINLPRTNYHLRKDNPVERLFWGQIPLERATSFFFYEKGSDFRLILHRLKYGGQKEIGAIMGRYMSCIPQFRWKHPNSVHMGPDSCIFCRKSSRLRIWHGIF